MARPQGSAERLGFTEALETAELAAIVLDARGAVAWCNAHLARLLGLSREEVLGEAGPIDLVLTDVVMPGMGGAALAQRLRAARPGIRVLFMSGYSADLPKALAPTGGSLVQKPFTPATLLARVAEAIRAAPDDAGEPG